MWNKKQFSKYKSFCSEYQVKNKIESEVEENVKSEIVVNFVNYVKDKKLLYKNWKLLCFNNNELLEIEILKNTRENKLKLVIS